MKFVVRRLYHLSLYLRWYEILLTSDTENMLHMCRHKNIFMIQSFHI